MSESGSLHAFAYRVQLRICCDVLKEGPVRRYAALQDDGVGVGQVRSDKQV